MLLTPQLSASPLAVPLLARHDDHSIRNANQRIIKSIKSQYTAPSVHLTTVAPTKWSQIEKFQLLIDENTSKSIESVDESVETWSRTTTNDSPESNRALREIRPNSNRVNNFEIRKSLNDRAFFSNVDLIPFNYGTNGNNQQQDATLGANTSLSFSNVHNNVNFKRRFLSAIDTDQISLLGERTTDRQVSSLDSNRFNNNNNNQLLFVNSSALKFSKNVRSVSASAGENSSDSENIGVSKSHYRDPNGGSGSDVIDGVLKNEIATTTATTTTETNNSSSSSTSKSVLSEIQKGNGNGTVTKTYGYIFAVVAISLIGAFAITLVGAVRCLRATRRASRALALPIPLLPEDRTPLNAEPEHPVPMLSVQSPGYAGMERLGVPARTSLGSPPHDRNHIGRRMRVDPLSRDILVRDVRNHHNNTFHYQHHFHQTLNLTTNDGSININNGRSSGSSENDFNATTTTTGGGEMRNSGGHSNNSNSRIENNYRGSGRPEERRCPHHVPLPDSEWGQDRDLQIRTHYQQAEITRSYITAPPNRTVLDVPEQSYNLFPSSSPSNGMAATSCNLGPNQQHHHLIQHSTHHLSQNHHHHQQQQQPQHQQQKSKPSLIKNFFMKMGSPKSPSSSSSPSPSLSASSSSSSTSSSSSSSLAHPNSAVQSAVNATNFNPGSRLGSLSMITSSTTATVIPLMANITTISGSSNNHHHHHHHFHQTQQQPQQQLVGSTNHNSLSVVGSSCTASSASLGSSSSSSSASSSTSSIASLATQSIDCCYTQATSVRPRTPNVNSNVSSHATITTTEIGANHNNNNQQPSHHQHQRDAHI